MSLLAFLQDRRQSFHYAMRGIRLILSTQVHAKIHLLAATCVALAGWRLDISAGEWSALLLCIALVWVAEGINTAIEFTVDLASPTYHPLAGKAKDTAAGAVLLAACFAAVIGGIVFIPKL